jgi:hypothetical protein
MINAYIIQPYEFGIHFLSSLSLTFTMCHEDKKRSAIISDRGLFLSD